MPVKNMKKQQRKMNLSNDEDVVHKAYLDTKISHMEGHISILE